MVVNVGRGKIAEEGGGVTKGVLAATDVKVSTVKRVSPMAGEGEEARRVGAVAVVESEIV